MSLQSTDAIADMLTRIRNAINVGKNQVQLPASKQKIVIARELVKAGYLVDVKITKAKPRDELTITIAGDGSSPVITEISRISRPGLRKYSKFSEIPKIKSGRGTVLISTSKGVMTGAEAIKKRLGGELILAVY